MKKKKTVEYHFKTCRPKMSIIESLLDYAESSFHVVQICCLDCD